MNIFRFFLIYAVLLLGVSAQGAVIAPLPDSGDGASAASEAAKDAVTPPAKDDAPAITPLGADGKPLPDIHGKLTLEDCIRIALANSPQAVSAQLTLQNAYVNLNLAKAEFLPTASVGASQGYNNGKTAGSTRTDHGSSDVYAQAQLSLSGITDIARNVKMQKLALEQAQLNLDSVKTTSSARLRRIIIPCFPPCAPWRFARSRAICIRTSTSVLRSISAWACARKWTLPPPR